MSNAPSPCIGVCKFKRPGPAGDHCIGCSMTKGQKKLSKAAKKKAMPDFVALVVAQQQVMGRYRHWRAAYMKRCLKKGAPVPAVVRKAG
ncbi:hypothetical protein JANAI62_20430 [Jannaschia pagri]|uniref:DUF1289 domain-containing protein n=1 Tax=Jannaschia pagri TaxID=2829797 RepID=A0ABQ4NLY3_9RHOB|nr:MULTISPECIES: DUF1289 domain-containing protein [unclassified Jannaschia]GIT91586.1 hypothetical protein JANAI61_20440 [Jannaschia sp. AI_61]GIT95420.1 hypothetical protein JANAI62_20430 [Jannaschia sp. AI_62]